MKLYAGIDLHSSNNYLGIIDEQGRRVWGKRLRNDLEAVLEALEPYREKLCGTVVESTYNWYWLVDGLMERGLTVHLANPAALKAYEGLKFTDDKWDAYDLADRLRLGILREGYIYPKEERPMRDLLRRRMLLVKQRTTLINSFQSMVGRHLGRKFSADRIKRMDGSEVRGLFNQECLRLAGVYFLTAIHNLSFCIRGIEGDVLGRVKLHTPFRHLLTVPGIGDILGLTIMLEVGDIGRFPTVGDYSSYCRLVRSEKLSNGKLKGRGNRKNGNRYLAWAYGEAAHFAVRYDQDAQKYYQRKASATKGVVASKALAHKICRATYWMMKNRAPFDAGRLFGRKGVRPRTTHGVGPGGRQT